MSDMPASQHPPVQNLVEAMTSPSATLVSAAAATSGMTLWFARLGERIHDGAQVAIDLVPYATILWLLIQCVCLLHKTFFKRDSPDEEKE